jgi:hypothetical protein
MSDEETNREVILVREFVRNLQQEIQLYHQAEQRRLEVTRPWREGITNFNIAIGIIKGIDTTNQTNPDRYLAQLGRQELASHLEEEIIPYWEEEFNQLDTAHRAGSESHSQEARRIRTIITRRINNIEDQETRIRERRHYAAVTRRVPQEHIEEYIRHSEERRRRKREENNN